MNSDILQRKLKEAAKLKDDLNTAESEVDALKKILTPLSYEILKIMEETEVEKVSAHGYTFFIEERETVKTPKTAEEKREFFDFLRSKDLFDDMVSINSSTLNSLFKSLNNEAIEAGNLDFRIPGLEAPTSSKSLKLRKS